MAVACLADFETVFKDCMSKVHCCRILCGSVSQLYSFIVKLEAHSFTPKDGMWPPMWCSNKNMVMHTILLPSNTFISVHLHIPGDPQRVQLRNTTTAIDLHIMGVHPKAFHWGKIHQLQIQMKIEGIA